MRNVNKLRNNKFKPELESRSPGFGAYGQLNGGQAGLSNWNSLNRAKPHVVNREYGKLALQAMVITSSVKLFDFTGQF